MSRKIKKLMLQYQFLSLEYDDIEDEIDQFQEDWSSRFGKYFVKDNVEMWKNEETGELRDSPPEKDKPKKEEKNSKLKKAYRKLSTIFHPDRGGSEDKFHELKTAYEKDDFLGILSLASEVDVEIEVGEDDIELIEKSISSLEHEIKKSKMSMIWQYYKGDVNAKKSIIQQLEMLTGKKIEVELEN